MQTRKIFARALAATIPVQFDVMQQAFRSPIRFRLVQHPGEAERDFEKRPAIHSLKIYRGRLDPIVNFESKVFVARSDKSLSHDGSPFADRQSFPASRLGL